MVDVYDTSMRSWLVPMTLSQPRSKLAGAVAGGQPPTGLEEATHCENGQSVLIAGPNVQTNQTVLIPQDADQEADVQDLDIDKQMNWIRERGIRKRKINFFLLAHSELSRSRKGSQEPQNGPAKTRHDQCLPHL